MNLKKFLLIFSAVAIFIIAATLIFIFLLNRGDYWVCRNGEWIKHGNPRFFPSGICEVEDSTEKNNITCESFLPENCPEECVVCPPCMACSSISCQRKEFCAEMGIDKSWYENIKKQIKNFSECVAAGYPIAESYPRQCRVGEQVFVENITGQPSKEDSIIVSSPEPDQKIESPLSITGRARGSWFFEADFPIRLFDEDGTALGLAIAKAQGDWMTTDFVPFSAELEFITPKGKTGTLIFKKDNPSGLPEHDDELRVSVAF